ncbi:major facilitator superfamily protein [Escherichia coli]|uniref:Major facilitator superfamily protein n=1 Tax=Escherichia coli TaxID=562 RepID=A0A2X1NU56_ECOLX|nr:major facilitator superfamily protein [Escherichia coli]
MADAICQLRDAATCFFTIGFFVFGPQMLIGMAAAECSTKSGRGGDGVCRLVCLSGGVACWLAAGESTRYLALERIFVVISIAAGISALLLLPFLNAQTPREA